MTAAETSPVVVLDVRDWDWRHRPPSSEWLRALREWTERHEIEARDTYRIEVHLIDTLFARVFQYDRTDEGYRYCPRDHNHGDDADGCEIARRTTFTVVLTSMPPEGP